MENGTDNSRPVFYPAPTQIREDGRTNLTSATFLRWHISLPGVAESGHSGPFIAGIAGIAGISLIGRILRVRTNFPAFCCAHIATE